jgi:peptide/nickel transport system permease protein
MKWLRRVAWGVLLLVGLCALAAPALAPYPYDRQFRDAPAAPPGGRFPMGTDEVGRDRLSRLIYATRVSAMLAPAAAAVSIVLALLIAGAAGGRGGLAGHALSGFTTICLSLPWIFLFIILRAQLPLNTGPLASVLLTFGLMGVAGWRIAAVQAWPHLRTLAVAQFRVLVPAYILSEASLGLLGLGVADPLPSWGNLLQDLQHPDVVKENPWVLAPLGLLMIVMICLEALQPSREAAL